MPRTSDKDQAILQFVTEFMNRHGYAPSVREIGAAVNLRSTASVHYQLRRLRDQGLLSVDGTKNRAITLPEELRGGRIPVVGVVTAGLPILAVENIEGYLPWDEEDCFALRVRGDSMIDAGILEGDKVIVHSQETARSGEIVVALLEDEATIKRLRLEENGVWLVPENEHYQPIDGRYSRIIGKVRAVVRTYA